MTATNECCAALAAENARLREEIAGMRAHRRWWCLFCVRINAALSEACVQCNRPRQTKESTT
jgi:hypothetical protein